MLHLVTYLPLLVAIALLFVKKDEVAKVRRLALAGTGLTFVLSLLLVANFQPASNGIGYFTAGEWVPTFGIRYAVGVNAISLVLIVLATFLAPLTLKASWSSIEDRLRDFCFWFLLLESFMIGVLTARDVFQFFVFWELLLLPMLFIVGRWGGHRRIYAAVKFFIYTMVGSLPMLVSLTYVYLRYRAEHPSSPSFLIEDWQTLHLTLREQTWCFVGMGLSFAIKLPLFPVHTWLPDAHTEAPTPGSIALAGVLLKMGGYGFLALAMPLFPDAARALAPTVMVISVIGVIYGALVAMVQPDLKRLVAYSSVSHMGMVTLGIFSLTQTGISGGVVQMVAHGISTGALFLLVGFIYERRHTRLIADFGGIAKVMPLYTVAFLLVTFSSIALPGTNGFVGEILILFGAYSAWPAVTAFAVTGAILGAWYMLLAVKRVFFGKIVHAANEGLRDLTRRELLLVLPFAIVILLTGVKPKPMLDFIRDDVARLDAAVHRTIVPANHTETTGR